MPNLLLVGPTNNGKSMIVEKFRRTHPASSDADQEHIRYWSCRCRPNRR
jgi:predicted ATPase with chaperone activity